MTDVVGQVSSLRNIQTVQVAGNDKKKIEFHLIHQVSESRYYCGTFITLYIIYTFSLIFFQNLIISGVKALHVVNGVNMQNSLKSISNKQIILIWCA